MRSPGEMTDLDCAVAGPKAQGMYDLEAPNGVENMTKIVAGRQLWNYDNLEPAEKKTGALRPVGRNHSWQSQMKQEDAARRQAAATAATPTGSGESFMFPPRSHR